MVIWVELSLLVVLGGALLLLNPLIALFAVGYFGLIAILMNQILKGWAYSTGKVMAESAWESNVTVQDGIATYREITVADRRQHYIDRFRSSGGRLEAYADQQFISQLPRYGMEIALVVAQACWSSFCSSWAPWNALLAPSRCSSPPRPASCPPCSG